MVSLNIVSVLSATGLFTLKLLILCYMNFTSIIEKAICLHLRRKNIAIVSMQVNEHGCILIHCVVNFIYSKRRQGRFATMWFNLKNNFDSNVKVRLERSLVGVRIVVRN